MEAKIVEFEETNVVGVSANFISILSEDRNNYIIIPKLWDIFNSNIKSIENRKDSSYFGLCEMLPDYCKSRPDELSYMACTEVNKIESIPQGMIAKTIPSGTYAVFTHKGKLEKLGDTMNYIFETWISSSSYQLDNRPEIEFYDQRFKPESDDSEFDIYIPVKGSGTSQ